MKVIVKARVDWYVCGVWSRRLLLRPGAASAIGACSGAASDGAACGATTGVAASASTAGDSTLLVALCGLTSS